MKTLLTILFSFFIFQFSSAKPEKIMNDIVGWHILGEKISSLNDEEENILILGSETLESIKFVNGKSPVNLVNVEIYYDDDAIEIISINQQIKSKRQSEPIYLNSSNRDVKKIV